MNLLEPTPPTRRRNTTRLISHLWKPLTRSLPNITSTGTSSFRPSKGRDLDSVKGQGGHGKTEEWQTIFGPAKFGGRSNYGIKRQIVTHVYIPKDGRQAGGTRGHASSFPRPKPMTSPSFPSPGNGLMLGLTYVLIASGFSLIYGLCGFLNFAHGEFYMLGPLPPISSVKRLG